LPSPARPLRRLLRVAGPRPGRRWVPASDPAHWQVIVNNPDGTYLHTVDTDSMPDGASTPRAETAARRCARPAPKPIDGTPTTSSPPGCAATAGAYPRWNSTSQCSSHPEVRLRQDSRGRPRQVDKDASTGRGWTGRHSGADGGGVPRPLAQGGDPAESRAVDRCHVRNVHPSVHQARLGDEAAGPAPGPRRADLVEHPCHYLPVLRTGEGRAPSRPSATLLCRRRVLLVVSREARTVVGSAWQHTGLVFRTAFGAPVEPRNFNRCWDARCRKAGVRKITVHDARRTCGSLLADLDVHPRVAMRIVRHARFSVTMEIYTQVSSKATREALKRLGESLDG
jgi:hypothetical protein